MHNLWFRDTPVPPSFGLHDEHNTADKDYHQMNNTTTDCSGCSSRIHFGNTSYTLGFGHLFSGNLQNYQSIKCYESCSSEVPECYSNPFNDTSQINRIQSQQHPVVNHSIEETMETIRNSIKNIEKQYNYSIPSVPCRCDSVMNSCNIDKAAALLERAANAMSTIANIRNQFR